MTKKIEFASMPEAFLPLPLPAKKYVPDWYKEAEKYAGGKRVIGSPDGYGKTTFKACAPFFDSLVTGYIVELWQDIEVVDNNGEALIRWDSQPNVLIERDSKFVKGIPFADEYYHQHFAWQFPYAYKTPPGYSVLITHPLNRYDLPFTTMSGIVDADNGIHMGNIPFLLKKDFKGIIEKGTPIVQIIPIKQESWKSVNNNSLLELNNEYEVVARRVSDWYKKKLWKPKDYR